MKSFEAKVLVTAAGVQKHPLHLQYSMISPSCRPRRVASCSGVPNEHHWNIIEKTRQEKPVSMRDAWNGAREL